MHAIIFIKNVFAVVVSVDHLVHYCVFALLLRHRMVFAHNDLIQNQYKTLNNNSEFQDPICSFQCIIMSGYLRLVLYQKSQRLVWSTVCT
jgi:hypothetical protein